MTRTVTIAAILIVSIAESGPAPASQCAGSIAMLQSNIDAAIEARSLTQPWRPESLSALRGHQPTPRSLAVAEDDPGLVQALGALNRARDADRAGDINRCNREIASVSAALRHNVDMPTAGSSR
ncbi:hypothetical protein [Bradyrhizobium sp. HKCCYLR20261]|uniref:hypothetical protein n=1 Tax=unclassified Bradyrhizobium TaxID=2631580 RepID=UPI003EB7C336